MQTLMQGDAVVAKAAQFTWSEPHQGWSNGDGMVYGDSNRSMTIVDDSKMATEMLIDIGPFMDRFDSAKMAVLTSPSTTVQAILKDMFARKWIDLTLPEVGAAIDAISADVPQVTSAMKQSILKTAVTPKENLALRKLYFQP